MSHSEKELEILSKIDSGEDLNESELRLIAFDYEIDCEEGDDSRWSRHMTTLAEIGGRYFVLYWARGLTECQESEFYEQPVEVFKQPLKTLVIKKEVTEYLDRDGKTEFAQVIN